MTSQNDNYNYAVPTRPLRSRALRSIGHRTHVNLVRIEMDGPASSCILNCEVEFWGDETAGYEISSVQPYELRTLPTGRKGTMRHFLDCPEWLEDALAEAIDPGSLKPEAF